MPGKEIQWAYRIYLPNPKQLQAVSCHVVMTSNQQIYILAMISQLYSKSVVSVVIWKTNYYELY